MTSTQSPTAFDEKAGTKVCSKLSELSLNAREGEPKDSGVDDASKSKSRSPRSPSLKMGYTPLKFKHSPGKDPTLSPNTRALMAEILAEIGDPKSPNEAWKEKANKNRFGFDSGALQPPQSFPKPSGGDWPPLPDSPFSDTDL